MEKNNLDYVPRSVYDDAVVRGAHREHIHWVAHLAMLLAILLIIGGFIWYLNQYEYVSNESVTVDGADGVANYIGKDGNIYNGEDSYPAIPITAQEERQDKRNP